MARRACRLVLYIAPGADVAEGTRREPESLARAPRRRTGARQRRGLASFRPHCGSGRAAAAAARTRSRGLARRAADIDTPARTLPASRVVPRRRGCDSVALLRQRALPLAQDPDGGTK